VRKALRIAAEIAERDPETAAIERPLTDDEIERAAMDLGIPRTAMRRALDADAGEIKSGVERSWFLGAPTRVLNETELEVEQSDADREDLLEDIRLELGETGTVETVGKTFTWHLTPTYGGRTRDISVRLRSREGRTRLVVEEKMGRQAAGLFVGLGVGGGVGPLGAYIAAIVNLGAVGLIFPALWIPLMLLLARTIYSAWYARREKTLGKLFAKIKASAASWPRSGATAREKVRVETSAEAHAADEESAEAEAEQASAARRRST